jgi:SAM-dependent methyltransferase
VPGAATDAWASGDAYEPYVGRWSRLVAREFLAWLAPVPGGRWVDAGCGTGALAETIIEMAAPALLHGVDPSLAYIKYARQRLSDERALFIVADARLLPLRAASVHAAVSGLALNFIPDPGVALQELARVCAAGGIVACYVWDYAGQMQIIRRFWDAAAELDPGASELDEANRFPICHPTALETLFRGAGLHEVESLTIDIPARFRDFDDYWQPFLGGQGPAPGYVMGLSEGRRAELRDRLRATLPAAADGSITLLARAWAVRGTPV